MGFLLELGTGSLGSWLTPRQGNRRASRAKLSESVGRGSSVCGRPAWGGTRKLPAFTPSPPFWDRTPLSCSTSQVRLLGDGQ